MEIWIFGLCVLIGFVVVRVVGRYEAERKRTAARIAQAKRDAYNHARVHNRKWYDR